MEGSRIFGILILVAIAIALTIGVFGRKRGVSKDSSSSNIPRLSRADYTLVPPFVNPFEDDDIGIGPYHSFKEMPPPPEQHGKGCGCQMKKH